MTAVVINLTAVRQERHQLRETWQKILAMDRRLAQQRIQHDSGLVQRIAFARLVELREQNPFLLQHLRPVLQELLDWAFIAQMGREDLPNYVHHICGIDAAMETSARIDAKIDALPAELERLDAMGLITPTPKEPEKS